MILCCAHDFLQYNEDGMYGIDRRENRQYAFVRTTVVRIASAKFYLCTSYNKETNRLRFRQDGTLKIYYSSVWTELNFTVDETGK